MPGTTHSLEVRAPIEAVWRLVSDMDYFAPLTPGYFTHEAASDGESSWTLKGNVGMLNKTVKFEVRVTEWTEPSKVAFSLLCRNEQLTGEGYSHAEPTGPETTR